MKDEDLFMKLQFGLKKWSFTKTLLSYEKGVFNKRNHAVVKEVIGPKIIIGRIVN